MVSNRMTILNYISKFKFKEIKSVIFTTYNFDKDFFDKNILPAVLDIKPSKNEKALVHSSNEKLSKIPVAIFYDFNALSEQYNYNSSYKYQLKAIKLKDGFFHTKNIIICGKDTNDKPKVICTVASANLTRSAYASNIEVFSHIEIIGKDENFNALLGFLKRLQDISKDSESKSINALKQSIEFIENELIRPVQKSNNKLKFILEKKNADLGILDELFSKKNNEVTLISPYWKDEMINALPINENNKVIISKEKNAFTLSKEGFEKLIEKKYKVYYSTLLDSNKQERFLHAKCYIVKDGNNYTIALGSSNFTQSGLGISGYNIESMLFLESENPIELFKENEINLLELKDIEKSSIDNKENKPILLPFSIEVVLDWTEKKYLISIDNPEYIFSIKLPGVDKIYLKDINKEFEKTLKSDNLSLSNTFIVEYKDKDGNPYNYKGFILEINLEDSKREYFYNFSYSEILDSWIKPKDISHYQPDERDESEEFNDYDNFTNNQVGKENDIFDNYYEIYRAFYNFRKKLTDKENKEFLIRTGPTSLHKLYESISKDDKPKDEVLNYLILLEIKDILKIENSSLFDNLDCKIQEIENKIKDENLTEEKINWFKDMLFTELNSVGDNNG